MQIQGNYGKAMIYNDTVEAEAISQIQLMLDQPMAAIFIIVYLIKGKNK